MSCRLSRHLLGLGAVGAILFTPLPSFAQRNPSPQDGTTPGNWGNNGSVRASLMVMVRDSGGGPIDLALVTLSNNFGSLVGQARADVGRAEFGNLVPGNYTVKVVSNGYETAEQLVNCDAAGTIISITLKALAPGSAAGASGPPTMPVLAPKAQKYAAQALAALRAGKPADARQPLEEAYRLAPTHPYVNFLYGFYFSRTNDWPGAVPYWEKAISILPGYVDPLLYLGEDMLRQNRPADAFPYLNRAIESDPSAWRPHAMLAQALLADRQYGDSIHQADRALELGHAQAVSVEPLLARALIAQGNKERAITVLQNYLHDRPDDSSAQKALASLRAP
jgi:Tfp pilus assembly protein PilF